MTQLYWQWVGMRPSVPLRWKVRVVLDLPQVL